MKKAIAGRPFQPAAAKSAPVTNADDARHGARRVGVDLHDLRVRPIAAHEISRRLPVDGDIGGVAAMAGDEAGVLTPAVELMFGHNPSPT